MHRKPGAGSLLYPTPRAVTAGEPASIGKRTLVGQAYRSPSAGPASAPAAAPRTGAPAAIGLRAFAVPRRPAVEIDDPVPPARRPFAPPRRSSTSVSTSTSLLQRAFGRRRAPETELESDPAPVVEDSPTPEHSATPTESAGDLHTR